MRDSILMRQIKNIICVVAGVITLGCFNSCADYLDKEPDDMLTLEMIFSDKVRTEDWLAGIYSNIPDSYMGTARQIGYDSMGDDLAPSIGWQPFGWDVLDKQVGNWNPETRWEANYWEQLPKRIRSAYIFIENVKPNDAQLVTQAEVDLMKNEARALIAYYYALLIEGYGTVPLNTVITSSEASEEELMAGQVPYDQLVDWIDKELQEAAQNLPANYTEAKKYGRFTSVMCQAVRARMLLFAASPLVNGNPDYVDFKNDKGENLFNSTYDASKWERATKACKELMDSAHKAGHGLYYEFNSDGSIDPFLSYQNMSFRKFNEGNKEILFARPECDVKQYDELAQPRGTGGNGGMGMTQAIVDAFYMKNGQSPITGYNSDGSPIINPTSGYKEKGFSTAPEVRNTGWIECQGNEEGKRGQVTLEGTYNMYCNREPRFYVSVLYNRAWYRRENRTTRFCTDEWDGGPTHDAPQNGYLVRKKVHPDCDPRSGTFPYRPGILYRLGEAYLNYAEALNESNPGNPDILKYVNLIRERGGIPTYGSGQGQIAAPQGQEAVREAIHRERRVELNCEGIRYHDIRRWKQGEKFLNGNFWGMNFFGQKPIDDEQDKDAFFKRSVYQKRLFTKKNYWNPIPQKEVDKNPNLRQNPFWNE